MAEPGLQFEQGHGLLGVVQLRGDGRARTMAGDASTRVLSRDSGLLAQRGNQRCVEIAWWYRTSAEAEEQRHGLGGLGIDVERLRGAFHLPGDNRIADQWIDGFGVAGTGLVRRN